MNNNTSLPGGAEDAEHSSKVTAQPNTKQATVSDPERNDGGGEEADGSRTGLEVPKTTSAEVPLESLAPRYIATQHQTYLKRLNAALESESNRNIALTGRFGTGKSSVLDEFERTHERTRRIAISTLAPDTDDPAQNNAQVHTETNRIQKELVKQLIYSADAKTLKHSRFSRIDPLKWWPTYWQSAAAVLVAGILLYLLDWLPPAVGTGHGQPWYQQVGLWILFGAILSGAVTVGRQQLHGNFFVSDVSAAGTALKLSPRTPTFFDEYLEEIVNYFDEEDVDIVLLEDLDRYNNPHIFEALRQLNTLLNSTPKRKAKGAPVRFVYAVRDSLFEKLGQDTSNEGGRPYDAATAETERANRTKFFDLVIPMVPFISHRSAQDLLHRLLADAAIVGVDRRLVDLVAQHATDMRLLQNIRNEYLVFAERLLEQNSVAPKLDPNGLFALVAYKNFHLQDFEEISRRNSDLDKVYDYRRDLVRTSISAIQRRKRELAAGSVHIRSMGPTVERLSTRLQGVVAIVRDNAHAGWKHFQYEAGGATFEAKQLSTYEFWRAVADQGKLAVYVGNRPGSPVQPLVTLSGDRLVGLFPEVDHVQRWDAIDSERTGDTIAQIDQDVAFLRGADFNALAARPEFTQTFHVSDGGDGHDVERTFAELVEATMKSKLAVELVKHGYINRDFSLYAAQFYGDFTGVDVATFIVHSVQPNIMDVDFQFTSDDAVENLLDAANDDFTHTAAAYNLDIVNYLIKRGDERIENIVVNIIEHFDADADDFLTAYMSSGAQPNYLAARLSNRGWPQTFTFLSGENVPEATRISAVDAALLAVTPKATYDTDDTVSDFIIEQYTKMPSFSEGHDRQQTGGVRWFLKRSGIKLPMLSPVHERLRGELVTHDLYELTAANLRSALKVTGDVSIDRLRANNAVLERCLSNPVEYLAIVAADDATEYTVISQDALVAVLPVVNENWCTDQTAALINSSSPDSTISTLGDVPSSTWQALASACRFHATIANVNAYLGKFGIDENLAALLIDAGSIDVDDALDEAEKTSMAVAILNAAEAIPKSRVRLNLVLSLGVNAVPIERLKPQGGDVLALLIKHHLVPDEASSFEHFQSKGWTAFEPAIAVSERFEDFMTADLVTGMIPDLLKTDGISDRVGKRIVNDLAEFVPTDDPLALSAAAAYALSHEMPLRVEQIRQVATASAPDMDLTMALLAAPHQSPPPEDIMQILAEFGEPYSNLATGAQRKFEVTDDENHRAVFRKLEEDGRCKVERKRRKTPVLAIELT